VTVFELDHVFWMVTDPSRVVQRLEDDGWVLDAGQAHPGQGTRNRRLMWPAQFFELLWVTDMAEARANPLRLDRRAEWITTDASPVGLGFRGPMDHVQRDEFWLYEALGPRIWVHRDNHRAPQRPLVFVLETTEEQMQLRRRRVRSSAAAAHRCRGDLREVRVGGPSAPSLPSFAGPTIRHLPGAHRLELIGDEDGAVRTIGDGLVIRW
jgi:hypothetical protein